MVFERRIRKTLLMPFINTDVSDKEFFERAESLAVSLTKERSYLETVPSYRETYDELYSQGSTARRSGF